MSRASPKAVFARSTRLLSAAAALFLLASGTPWALAGHAQPVEGNQSTQNAWCKLCFDATNAQSSVGSRSPKEPVASQAAEVCYTYVEIRDQQYGVSLGIIGVLQAPALDRTLLIALLPICQILPPEP